MNIKLMDVKRQHEMYQQEIENAVINVLRSGEYIGGKVVEEFENKFANYMGAKYAISCGNGTDALVIALRALNIGDGDEIITTPFTFFATGEAIASVGAKPVFVDVDEKTYCINCDLIEKKITKNTKAILAVHIYGQSCDMNRLSSISKMYNLYLVTDCAQSTGTEYNNKRENIIGDIACFSFFPTKNLGCDGDGGMIVTNDENLAKSCSSYKVHGSGKNGYDTLMKILNATGDKYAKDIELGETKYHNYLIGYNSRLDAIQAVILSQKIKHIDEYIDNRRKNAKYYNERLKHSKYGLPYEAPYSKHSYYIYALKCDNVQEKMNKLKKMGIATGIYYPIPLHLQGAFKKLGYKIGDLPTAEYLCMHTMAIPVFPELTNEEKEYVISSLLKV